MNLAANRATIVLLNTLERIEVEGLTAPDRAERILSEEFLRSELGSWGNFVLSTAANDAGIALRILDDRHRVVASAGVEK
jgi:hypothetical protein